jgi:transcriptional regulator with XRE-family HTH domain
VAPAGDAAGVGASDGWRGRSKGLVTRGFRAGFRPRQVRTYVLVMAYPAYLRERARELRTTKRLSLDEIAERLALPKTTVYYWIKDLPLERERRWSDAQRKGTEAMQRKFQELRDEAYARGLSEWEELAKLPKFRDFVVLYIAEGYKRSRNTASLCNSDPAVVALAMLWLRRLSSRTPVVGVQHHLDQEPDELRTFWGETLGVDPATVRLCLKSNSGQLRSRVWRCAYGVAAVTVYDTDFRSRLQAWIDLVHENWG